MFNRGTRSKERSFHLKVQKVYKIAVDSKSTQIEKTILEASQNTPAQVAFEPCEYIWGNDIKLKNINDLTIDGSGPTILYNKNKTEPENAPNKK